MTHRYKKYILFVYPEYYPGGGLKNLDSSYDSLEEAQEEANKKEAAAYPCTFYQIVDRDSWEVLITNDETQSLEDIQDK